jgi:hypothetical protein
VTASEFSFLALGLVLGLVTGAALVELFRARPASSHEVRLTVAHDAIPRRSSTLADDAFVAAGPEPARGGPADRRLGGAPAAAAAAERRTNVRYEWPMPPARRPSMAGAIPIGPGRSGPAPSPGRIMEPALPLTGIPPERTKGPEARMVAIPISGGDDPVLGALRGAAGAGSVDAGSRLQQTPAMTPAKPAAPAPAPTPATGTAAEGVAVATAVGLLERQMPRRGPGGPSDSPSSDAAATEQCAEERRLADERCELATRARAQADAAINALRLAQRSYDEHEAAAVTASWKADPRAVHEAKDAAQGGFRSAVAAASSPDQLEAAARDWLTEINRINSDSREATTTAAREHAAALEIGATLERLGLEADAARISAANADASCLAAREAVAECDERPTEDPSSFLVPPVPVGAGAPRLEEDETLGQALEAGGEPRIFRLLHGDRQAMTTLVAALADTSDPDAKRRWQLQMTNLVEAIVADAIEASALDFPPDHEFWGVFTRIQGRDIANALSSLGYRFDGLGGWADGRLPSQRDLSLALGYAGIDPMRVRHWPTEEGTAELFRDVSVAADEYLAGIAGDLTLAEMVAMLGRRADGLAEVWNHWGTIRPLLLDES